MSLDNLKDGGQRDLPPKSYYQSRPSRMVQNRGSNLVKPIETAKSHCNQASETWKITNISAITCKKTKFFKKWLPISKKNFLFWNIFCLQISKYYEAEMPFHRHLYQLCENRHCQTPQKSQIFGKKLKWPKNKWEW